MPDTVTNVLCVLAPLIFITLPGVRWTYDLLFKPGYFWDWKRALARWHAGMVV